MFIKIQNFIESEIEQIVKVRNQFEQFFTAGYSFSRLEGIENFELRVRVNYLISLIILGFENFENSKNFGVC